MVLEESSTCVSCLHKQSPFLFGLRSNYFGIRSSHPGPRRYRPISRPIFLIDRFDSFIHSFNIIQFINSQARQCQKLFVEYLKESRAYRKQVSDSQHRFLTWASFLGAFASVNVSLDARLRHAPDIKELMLAMLRVLRRNLERGNNTIRADNETVMIDGAIYGMTGAIDRLHRLATAIRQSPRTDEVERVLNFASKREPDGFSTFILAMIQYLFPDAEETLQTQLTESIIYRRNRLLWSLKHSKKLRYQRKDDEANEPVKEKTPAAIVLSEFNSSLQNRDALPSHIDADLRPFVCCSEECGKFPPAFSSTRNWKNHMQENHRTDWAQYIHRITWPCPYCKGAVTPFLTEDLLVRHLKDDLVGGHPAGLDNINLAKIVVRPNFSNPRPLGECPLCESSNEQPEDSSSRFDKHFANHLRHLAFLSIHWWGVDTGETGDEVDGSDKSD
ncbi:uncharacterized protein K441DRAFT_595416, partial [Cenococcum geophilum 1.58]